MDSGELSDIRQWINSNDLTLLVFTTPDCGVCEALRPRIAELGERFAILRIRYVDAVENPEVSGQFEVFAVPVYVLSVQGNEAARYARHFGVGQLEAAVERFAGLLQSS